MVEGLRREVTQQMLKQPSPRTPRTPHRQTKQLTETVPVVVRELWLVLRDTACREGGWRVSADVCRCVCE